MCTEALQTKPLELAILVQIEFIHIFVIGFSVIVFYSSLLYSPSINTVIKGQLPTFKHCLLMYLSFRLLCQVHQCQLKFLLTNYHEEQSCDSPSMPPQSYHRDILHACQENQPEGHDGLEWKEPGPGPCSSGEQPGMHIVSLAHNVSF